MEEHERMLRQQSLQMIDGNDDSPRRPPGRRRGGSFDRATAYELHAGDRKVEKDGKDQKDEKQGEQKDEKERDQKDAKAQQSPKAAQPAAAPPPASSSTTSTAFVELRASDRIDDAKDVRIDVAPVPVAASRMPAPLGLEDDEKDDDVGDEKSGEKSPADKRKAERKAEKKRVETDFGGGKQSCEHPLMATLRKELKTFRLAGRDEGRAHSSPAIFASPDEEWQSSDLVCVFRTFWRSQQMRVMLRTWANWFVPEDTT